MSGLNLGFRIEDEERIVFDDGSWRFATDEEGAIWPLVAIAEAADVLRQAVWSMPDAGLHVDDPRYVWWNGPLREACERYDEAFAAFRAAKEKQRDV